jgi:hypothetical protein
VTAAQLASRATPAVRSDLASASAQRWRDGCADLVEMLVCMMAWSRGYMLDQKVSIAHGGPVRGVYLTGAVMLDGELDQWP